MSLSELLSLLIAILSLLMVLVSLGYIRSYKKFVASKDKAGLNSKRESIESRIYTIQNQLMDDSYNFIDTNRLLIKDAADNKLGGQIPNLSFFQSLGIDFNAFEQNDREGFCLMPFHKKYYPVYAVIKEACSEECVICSRSDEHYTPGNLLQQIIISIIKSKFIFAVLDGRNPNVFYEIGLSQALGKPVYLIAHYEQRNNIPFDISSSRLVLYKHYNDLENQIKKIIKKENNGEQES